MPAKSHSFDASENPLVLNEKSKGAYKGDPTKPFVKTNFSKSKSDFHWVYSDEPHRTRRAEILKAHPEMKKLFGPEPLTAVIVFAITLSQIWIASWIATQPWWVIILVTYCYGCTVNHSLQLANHEISHNLVFDSLFLNFALGFVANLATGIPSSVTFRIYHMEHHQYQGVDTIDTDIPSEWELKTFTTTFTKFLWMCGQSFAYGFRPVFTNPKPVNKEQILNGIVVFAFDYWMYHTFGLSALLYLVACTFIGIGLHPAAGHFIAEHYEFVNGFETYSYIGPCNYVNFNVGYHIEHHDFPKIPWSRISRVREIAPEWYEHLPYHTSYTAVIWRYVTDPNIGPWSRIKRSSKKQQKKQS